MVRRGGYECVCGQCRHGGFLNRHVFLLIAVEMDVPITLTGQVRASTLIRCVCIEIVTIPKKTAYPERVCPSPLFTPPTGFCGDRDREIDGGYQFRPFTDRMLRYAWDSAIRFREATISQAPAASLRRTLVGSVRRFKVTTWLASKVRAQVEKTRCPLLLVEGETDRGCLLHAAELFGKNHTRERFEVQVTGGILTWRHWRRPGNGTRSLSTSIHRLPKL